LFEKSLNGKFTDFETVLGYVCGDRSEIRAVIICLNVDIDDFHILRRAYIQLFQHFFQAETAGIIGGKDGRNGGVCRKVFLKFSLRSFVIAVRVKKVLCEDIVFLQGFNIMFSALFNGAGGKLVCTEKQNVFIPVCNQVFDAFFYHILIV